MGDLNQLFQKADIQKPRLPVGSCDGANQFVMMEGRLIHVPERESKRRSLSSSLQGYTFHIDGQVSTEMKKKVVEAISQEGALLLDEWFVGCTATHIECEEPSVQKYLGHSGTIVTPLWVLKTVREGRLQRLVHLSADLAKQTATVLETFHSGIYKQDGYENACLQDAPNAISKVSSEIRQKVVSQAKDGVRQRRLRRMQTCQTPIRPITPASLLDSICWAISEPPSTASIYTDSSSTEDFNANGKGKESEISFVNMSRPLTESEKSELILKSHFLTILFPVDRFSEMGPRSRTYISDKGFTCLQVLGYIYTFYQESMSDEEIEMAIHSDSRHADRLRSLYASRETTDCGYVEFTRIDFLGSRRSFEMLKRVPGDNNSNVYELLIRA